jgi:hypothetical protein
MYQHHTPSVDPDMRKPFLFSFGFPHRICGKGQPAFKVRSNIAQRHPSLTLWRKWSINLLG